MISFWFLLQIQIPHHDQCVGRFSRSWHCVPLERGRAGRSAPTQRNQWNDGQVKLMCHVTNLDLTRDFFTFYISLLFLFQRKLFPLQWQRRPRERRDGQWQGERGLRNHADVRTPSIRDCANKTQSAAGTKAGKNLNIFEKNKL